MQSGNVWLSGKERLQMGAAGREGGAPGAGRAGGRAARGRRAGAGSREHATKKRRRKGGGADGWVFGSWKEGRLPGLATLFPSHESFSRDGERPLALLMLHAIVDAEKAHLK